MSYSNPNSPQSSPYGTGSYLPNVQPPKKSNNTVLWVLGILGVVGVIFMGICCGGGYMVYSWGTNLLAEEIKPRITNDPAIQEHIGDIEAMSFDLGATQDHQGDDVMVFKIRGSKGSGQIEIEDQEDSQSCVLVLADGRRFDIMLEDQEWSEDDFSDGIIEEGEMELDEEALSDPANDSATPSDASSTSENQLPSSEPALPN